MDTKKIEKLAQGARTELLKETAATLYRVLAQGSTERLANPSAVRAVEEEVATLGESGLIERVAYTWFNRLCALRFMDVRGYTPIRVVSPRKDATTIAILADAQQGIFSVALSISSKTQQQVTDLLSGVTQSHNPLNDAYKELLVAACNHYANAMGYLFGGRGSLTSAINLLIPDDLISQNSIMRRICDGMDEEACQSVEVLGWLYQFYIAERKDEVFAGFKKNKKAGAAEIAPATQLFTPNWIVRYMVENSLGRLWLLNKPSSPLREKMQYYIENDGELEYTKISSPTEIKCLDPACGSGHILVYMFDLLYEMYEEAGYQPEDIPELILTNNLTGYEIDARAAEIASFALVMKALECDPLFLDKGIEANIIVLEKVVFDADELVQLSFLQGRVEFLDALAHLDEIGSLFKPDPSDMFLVDCCRQTLDSGSLFSDRLKEKIEAAISQCEALSQQFDVVVANPPYMGSKNLNSWLSEQLKNNYPDEKSDLCTCFIERSFGFAKKLGCSSMVTMQSWMFLSSFEDMRGKLLRNRTILSMAHLGARAFDAIGGEVVSTTAFVMSKQNVLDYEATYVRLINYNSQKTKEDAFLSKNDRFHANETSFQRIPGCPLAYWVSPEVFSAFISKESFGDIVKFCVGISTADNSRFTRFWHEVNKNSFAFPANSFQEVQSNKKWFPFNNGGETKRWYGNNYLCINWQNDGQEIKATGRASIRNKDFYFQAGYTWSDISTGRIGLRRFSYGHIFSTAGLCVFGQSNLNFVVAFLNSKVSKTILEVLCPSIHFNIGDLAKIPVLEHSEQSLRIDTLVDECVQISRDEWDSFETSWDFKHHPLLCGERTTKRAFDRWANITKSWLEALISYEEELNEIYIGIYGLEGELSSEVDERDVTFRCANTKREICSLISFSIGCMFGRYSLDKDGLILANQGDTVAEYLAQIPSPSFVPDENNIIPILDGEWFEDGAVFQFKRFLEVAYGKETLEENLRFIEQALGKDIRSYLVKDFYNDHIKIYKKRPIYWLFSSPEKSFSVLIYMHRYTENTVSEILSQYLRPFRDKLNVRIKTLRASGATKDTAEADKLEAVVKELEDWERDVIYPMAHEHIRIDLDDGIKVNYNKFPHALRKVTGLSEW